MINETSQTPAIPINTSDKYSELNDAQLLLVEDNLINQEIMLKMLANQGIQLDIANNGAEAVMMVKQNDYSAVLMDCQMPVMDGFEATRIIRNFPRCADLPIIAMTANVMKEDRERCLVSGMNSHLAKPIEWDKLFQTLAYWVKPTSLPNIYPSFTPTTETNQQDWTFLAEKLPGFDLKNLMTTQRVDREKALHLLDSFREQLILDGPEILNNIAKGNLMEAQKELHKLQGSNVCLGAKDFNYACTALEA
ncbi:MAG: response regulator, partial [Thiotrichaceae bacterium]|nr:response regulator [Thiotrichaceae bacterium]